MLYVVFILETFVFRKMKQILENNPNATPDELEAKALGYNVNFDDPSNLSGENGIF